MFDHLVALRAHLSHFLRVAGRDRVGAIPPDHDPAVYDVDDFPTLPLLCVHVIRRAVHRFLRKPLLNNLHDRNDLATLEHLQPPAFAGQTTGRQRSFAVQAVYAAALTSQELRDVTTAADA